MNGPDQLAGTESLSALDVRHDRFGLTRHLDAPPAAVYAAFADDTIRRRWFRLPGSGATYAHDFRPGGGETASSTFDVKGFAPERLRYRLHYLDLVADQRIVFAYETSVNDVTRWASLVTVLLEEAGAGTRLTWMEQFVFLARTADGSADVPHLRGGTGLRLNGLAVALREGLSADRGRATGVDGRCHTAPRTCHGRRPDPRLFSSAASSP